MKIHLLGPTGSGTSTLGKMIADYYGIPWFDTDEISWAKTDPPFTEMKRRDQRVKILKEIFENNNSLVLSGAAISWGNFIGNHLDIVIYKYVEQEIRIKRLYERAKNRHGDRILPGNDMYEIHQKLIDYTKQYETGGMEVRSKKNQLTWLNTLQCKIVYLEGSKTLQEEMKIVLSEIENCRERQNST
jgi:shikimate kinase